jgi:hypothetical protein
MDTNFCVYIHISSDGDVFYVGQGREHRAYCKSAIGRAKKWYTIAEKGYDVYIPYTDLTKDQAVKLEKKTILSLMEQGHPLVNKSIHDGVMTLTREMFEDSFEYKEDSKFGLVWKRDSINKKLIGKEAGTKNKITGYVTVSMDSGQYSAHRIVMALTNGVCPHDMQVNHINGNKSDNRIENLELVTAKENVQHALRTGLTKPCFGEANSAAIITEKIVLEMYEHFRKGLSNEEVADIYNIEWKHASLIRCGKRWKHLFKDHGYDIPRSTKTKVVTDEQILECLHLIDCGLINKDISDATGIERSTVSRIRSGGTLQVRIKTLLKLKGTK